MSHIFMCVRGFEHGCVGRLEDIYGCMVSPSTTWVLGIKLRVSGLAAGALT